MDFGVMWWQCANEKWEVEAAGVVLAGRLEQHHSMPATFTTNQRQSKTPNFGVMVLGHVL